MRPGFDLLGLGHPLFPFERILNELPKDTPIGWFWDAFGDSRHRLNWMLEKGFYILRPQMFWDDDHALVPMDVLRKGLQELKQLVGPDSKLYVSPSCEHQERSVNEVLHRLELVKEIIPYAIPVNNPMMVDGRPAGALVPGYLREFHGADAGECDLASTDGVNIYDTNAAAWVRRYGNKEHPCFLWASRFNLREIPDPGQKVPPINKRNAAPSLEYFRSIMRLAEAYGTPPTPDFKFSKFRPPSIYKTHAEDDQEQNPDEPDEPRENRPVLILKASVNTVDILTVHGTSIGKLPRYGSYPGGLTRYYSGVRGGIGLYGHQIGNKAKKESGSEFVWFRAGGQTFGPINPAFRQGSYREHS